MGVPVLVGDTCGGGKFAGGEGGMHFADGDREFVKDPAFRE